jgi:hypothetical protein
MTHESALGDQDFFCAFTRVGFFDVHGRISPCHAHMVEMGSAFRVKRLFPLIIPCFKLGVEGCFNSCNPKAPIAYRFRRESTVAAQRAASDPERCSLWWRRRELNPNQPVLNISQNFVLPT